MDERVARSLQVLPENRYETDAAAKQLAPFQGAIISIVTLERLSPWRRARPVPV